MRQAGVTAINLFLAYYADDFTGSTDVLESLALRGLRTALFVDVPNAEQSQRFGELHALGVAGQSRTMTPTQMEANLPAIFQSLLSAKPRFVHYKVCSTFDSSPSIGSIGKAIDLGHDAFRNRYIPLVIGAPKLKRYCAFGNLFATSGLATDAYRLDRHPTMSRHPITPMTESDIKLVLASQTERPVALIDAPTLDCGPGEVLSRLEKAKLPQGSILLFDTITTRHLETIGSVIDLIACAENAPQFVAGSSGVEIALLAKHYPKGEAKWTPPSPVAQTLVASGSCSPVTMRQIQWARDNGFAELTLAGDSPRSPEQQLTTLSTMADAVDQFLDAGASVVIHTQPPSDAGPDSRSIDWSGRLGDLLSTTLHRRRVQRIAVAGGDTSGSIARKLGIEAIEFSAPFAPGAPLCLTRSSDPSVDGLEITFKGGQVGYDDFFGSLLTGVAPSAG